MTMQHSFNCYTCGDQFTSKNSLFKHIKDARHQAVQDNTRAHVTAASDVEVIRSTASPAKGAGLGFRTWHYATVEAKFTVDGSSSDLCVDTGCTMSLVDRSFLQRNAPHAVISQMTSTVEVRGIGSVLHKSKDFAIIDLLFTGAKPTGASAIASIQCELHIVENLKANALLGIDTLGPQQAHIDLLHSTLKFPKCGNVVTPINVRPRGNKRTEVVVRTAKQVLIPLKAYLSIPIDVKRSALPTDRDMIFEPSSTNLNWGYHGGIYASFVDAEVEAVQAYNATSEPITLSRHAKLGHFTDYDEEGCFHTTVTNHYMARVGDGSQPKEAPNELGVTIYGDPTQFTSISALVNEYSDVFQNPGIIRLPPDEWMTIPLVDNWEDKAKFTSKVYPLGNEARQLVDKTFDTLHEQGKLAWSDKPTPFGSPVFVVYRTVNGVKKGRVVVDIRTLNSVTQPDNYPLPMQEDITSLVAGYPFISTIDAVSFFYQHPVAPEDRHKLAVNTHRGQEVFQVAVMGHRNSVPHVQRAQDNMLRDCRTFARAYIDDIVIFSRTLHEHVTHLRYVFDVLRFYNVTLQASKCFLAYPNIKLFGQRVDAFGLATHEDKLEAIQALKFPRSLHQLEKYLGLTGWLRRYIHSYAKVVEPLQKRKTELAKSCTTTGGKRKSEAVKRLIDTPSQEELEAYRYLQQAFKRPLWLAHFNASKILYFDLDASKEMGIGGIAYQLRSDNGITDACDKPARDDIEPLCFLSRELNGAETRYWITELETAGLVWMIRKLRHWIETARRTVGFTDHSAITNIVKQTTLVSSSSDRLNLRLIRASQYVSQFATLEVRHKAGRLNTVPDALSRLLRSRSIAPQKEEGELETLEAQGLCATPVQSNISDAFKDEIRSGYASDERWARILSSVQNSPAPSSAIRRVFSYDDGLLHYTDELNCRRICIPRSLEKSIFELAHDYRHHAGFHRTYQFLINAVYVLNLPNRLRLYIKNCPTCCLNETPRHRPFGMLQPILTPPIPGHTVTIDFVLGLPTAPSGKNITLNSTCKYSKKIEIIPGKTTWPAQEWASAFVKRCQLGGLGIPSVIISDRDQKFASEFWQGLFESLGTRLVMTTAYHPSANGQSERTNQTVEIALRHVLFDNSDAD